MNADNNQNDIKLLALKITRLKRWIRILAMALTAFLIFIAYGMILNSGSKHAIGPVSYDTAYNNVDKFRHRIFHTKKSHGVTYSKLELGDYLGKVFDRLTAAQDLYIDNWIKEHPGGFPNRAQYVWTIGFTWSVNKEDEGNKIDFVMVPVLVNKDHPEQVLDYYDEEKCPFYDRTHKVHIPGWSSRQSARPQDGEDVNYSFNTGTMFP
jgi:hypothetical protein